MTDPIHRSRSAARDARRAARLQAEDAAEAAERTRRADNPTSQERMLDTIDAIISRYEYMHNPPIGVLDLARIVRCLVSDEDYYD